MNLRIEESGWSGNHEFDTATASKNSFTRNFKEEYKNQRGIKLLQSSFHQEFQGTAKGHCGFSYRMQVKRPFQAFCFETNFGLQET
ncbi:hypothetical protein V6N13_024934 [Hibiscus sabdariffa]|uniref:Uncharacterized protein n=1 Tax=Hibiscus sabdariffa TaxID=183260 RepID=A0ABR2AIT3_9ROSI